MTSTALEKYEPRNWVALMAPAVELAKHVADTAFVPKGLRGNAPAIVAAIMYGDEVGLGPMQALAKIAVIDGRPSLSAEAQRALILAAGHDLWVVESTNTKVTVAGRRSGSDHTSSITWTLDDAKRAGLAGRQNWRAYPRQMLMARATAELARLIFADAVGGLLATEELEDGEPGEVNEAPATTKRKRASVARPETTQRPVEKNGDEPELPPLPDEPLPSYEAVDVEIEIPDDDPPSSDAVPSAPAVAGAQPTAEPSAPAASDPSGAPPTQGDPNEPAAVAEPQDSEYVITHAQRKRLFAIANENGVSKEHLRELVREMTGTESTTGMKVSDYESLVSLIESREAMFS